LLKLKHLLNSNLRNILVVFQKPNTPILTAESDFIYFEISLIESFTVLAELELAVEITTQLYCYLELNAQFFAKLKGRQRGRTSQTWFLNTILYKLVVIKETVSNFLCKRGMYL